MEFPFTTTKCLQSDAEGFSVLDGQQPGKYRRGGAGGGMNAHMSSSFFSQGATAASSPDA